MPRISSRIVTIAAAALLYLNGGALANAQSDPSLSPEEAKKLAHEAWVFGVPPVYIDTLISQRAGLPSGNSRRVPRNQLVHYRDFSSLTGISMNVLTVDCLYSVASIDLSAEPLVLSIPDINERYWSLWFVDGWNNIPQTFGTRISSGKGGEFLLVGPNSKEPIPAGLTQSALPTSLAILFARISTSGSSELSVVHDFQDKFRLVPLSKWRGDNAPQTPDSPDGDMQVRLPVQEQLLAMPPETFFDRLNTLLVHNPPGPADAPLMNRISRLGIGAGAKFDFVTLRPEIQHAMREGIAAGQGEVRSVDLGAAVNRWRYALDFGRFGTNYAYRAQRTLLGAGGTLAEDAIDPFSNQDSDGEPFDSGNRYVLTFRKEDLPPAKYMWSITLYNDEGSFAPNSAARHAIQSQQAIKFASDGSLSVFIQKDPPRQDQSSNWLPAPANGGFALVMRLYGPEKVVLDGSWKPPPVQRIR